MRTILFGRKHGKKEFEIILGPETHTSEQILKRGKLADEVPVNAVWAEVELWNENPVKSKLKFITPEDAKAQAELNEKHAADFERQQADLAKSHAKRNENEKAQAAKEHEKAVAKLNKMHDEIRAGFKS